MLTNTEIKAAKPKDKPYKLADEQGLHLLVNTTGVNKFFLVNDAEGNTTVMEF